MSHVDVFRPADGRDLIIKSDLADGLGGNYDAFRKNVSSARPATQGSSRFGRLSHNSFFARHNPHPGRVRHLKGKTYITHLGRVTYLESQIFERQ